MGMNILKWIENWYKLNCNGTWEHMFGVKIDTLDNPGWSVSINLEDTNLENKYFEKVIVHNGENDWIICRIEDKIFKGDGDPNKLIKILEIFRDWVECNS